MNNFLKIILIFIFITNCSFSKKSKFWTKQEIEIEKTENISEIFKKEKNFSKEFNSNLKISLSSKAINKSFLNNYDNNNGRVNYIGNLKKVLVVNLIKI